LRIISPKRLKDFWDLHAPAENPLRDWCRIVEKVEWTKFADIRHDFPSADQVGRLIVFNIGGNKYRLVAAIHFNTGCVYVRFIGTHAEYDRGTWKKDL